jgi:hypothetical protein
VLFLGWWAFLPRPPFVLLGVSSRGVAIHFFLAWAALAFHRMALPIAILHSSVATAAVAGALGSGTSGSAEVFGVGCTVAVSTVVSEHREDLFASASSSSWAVVVVWRKCSRL